MLHFIRDKPCLQTLYRPPKKQTTNAINSYCGNASLVPLNATSIDSNIPLADIIYNHYTESGQTLSAFTSNSPYLQRVKTLDECIYQRIVTYLATFSKYIYQPPPIDIPIQVLINDNLNTYLLYIFKIYNAICADNPDIHLIWNEEPTQLKAFNHYQIDLRFVPYSLYYIASKTTVQSSLQFDRHKFVYEDANGLDISDDKKRKEANHGTALDAIKRLTFLRYAKNVGKYKRFEVIIDRNNIQSTMNDTISKFVPCKGSTVPDIALDNATICKIVNSKGSIVSGTLNAEDPGVLTISFHVKPQSVDLYYMYGYGDGMIGSYVAPNNLRQALTPFFHNAEPKMIDMDKNDENIVSVTLDDTRYAIDYSAFTFGVNELHSKTRSLFANVKTENHTDHVVLLDKSQIAIDDDEIPLKDTAQKPRIWGNSNIDLEFSVSNDEPQEELKSNSDDESSLESMMMHSTAASSTPIHPIEESLRDKLTEKGVLTKVNLARGLAMAQETERRDESYYSDLSSNYEPNLLRYYDSLPRPVIESPPPPPPFEFALEYKSRSRVQSQQPRRLNPRNTSVQHTEWDIECVRRKLADRGALTEDNLSRCLVRALQIGPHRLRKIKYKAKL